MGQTSPFAESERFELTFLAIFSIQVVEFTCLTEFTPRNVSNFRQLCESIRRVGLMGAARKYRRYPDSVKLEVVRTANPYRFPELRIPRTTALYWIYKSAHLEKDSPEMLENERIRELQKEVERQQSLLSLISRVRSIFPIGFAAGKAISRPKRKRIVQTIQAAAKFNRIRDCLSVIGLSKNLYSQWLSEFFLCQSDDGACDQRKPHQLTSEEIRTMKRLVTSTKYSHVPIHSLCLLAQREGFLFCSVDSWYKYIQIFGWIRPRERSDNNELREGIRASRPNEIWHIDVTEVKTATGEVVYIQVVYDNFSRFVIAWKVTSEISALSTVGLLESAKRRGLDHNGSQKAKVMMDGGPENDNGRVLQFINSKNLTRLIARVDIHYSNSMVESLFRGLKSNFLSTEDLTSKCDVAEKVDFYFGEHNEKIPRAIFKGATPKEVFLNLWTELDSEKLKTGLRQARENRKASFRERSCGACDNLIVKGPSLSVFANPKPDQLSEA